MITPTYAHQLLKLERRLNQHVLGQPHATRTIYETLKAAASGLKGDLPVPLGVFFLKGPTGVGKTETGVALAKPGIFYPADIIPNQVTLNMGEYQQSHEVAKLVGSPVGYVGSDLPCAFHPVKANPHTIFIIDEIEKAHPDIPNALLAIFDKGLHRSGIGDEYTFEKSIFILTSNAADPTACFSPEFRNRMDAIIEYRNLEPDSYRILIPRKVEAMSKALHMRFGVTVQITPGETARLAEALHAQSRQPAVEPASIGFGRPLGNGGLSPVAVNSDLLSRDGLITPGSGARELSRILQRATSPVTDYLLRITAAAHDKSGPSPLPGCMIMLENILDDFRARIWKSGRPIAMLDKTGAFRLSEPAILPNFGPGSIGTPRSTNPQHGVKLLTNAIANPGTKPTSDGSNSIQSLSRSLGPITLHQVRPAPI